MRYVEAGASGYILKNDSLDDMIETIRTAQEGKVFVSPEIAAAMVERLSALAQIFSDFESSFSEDADQTPRELEVLKLTGKT